MNVSWRLSLSLVLSIGAASAGPFDDGVAAIDQQPFGNAVELWRPLEKHDGAPVKVGIMDEKGRGVEQNFAAVASSRRAHAERPELHAQYHAAVSPESGRDVAGTTAAQQVPAATQEVITYRGGRFVIVQSAGGACVIALQGQITTDAAPRFRDVLQRGTSNGCVDPLLLLESPGGVLFDALDLGYEIRRAGFRTVTRAACASACSMIFLAGRERALVGPRAAIGLHQPARSGGGYRVCDPTTYSSAARGVSSYIKAMIPAHAEEVIKLALETPCDKIEWVYGQRALELGIATRLDVQATGTGASASRQ